tara:strand:+ start:163 stop:600 length:438 start_codon:yes stop_codon:yes gene_type:complete
MTLIEKQIHLLETEIAQLKVQSNSGHNDGWLTKHYRDELDRANKAHLEKVAELEKMPKHERTNYEQFIADGNPEALLADGFADALIGYDNNSMCAVYDYEECCNVLMNRDGMTYEDAHEYMQFNVVNAVVGDFPPSFVTLFSNMS